MGNEQTDPELLRQLDAARESGELVQAVVRLHRRTGGRPAPAEVEAQTRDASNA